VIDGADFFALMPPNNATAVAAGANVEFPQNGPVFPASGITRVNASTFTLAVAGTYQVLFQVSVTEAGQLVVALNGAEVPTTMVGRATGTDKIVGMYYFTVAANTTISIRNPAAATASLIITPLAGGVDPVSAHLVITRVS